MKFGRYVHVENVFLFSLLKFVHYKSYKKPKLTYGHWVHITLATKSLDFSVITQNNRIVEVGKDI